MRESLKLAGAAVVAAWAWPQAVVAKNPFPGAVAPGVCWALEAFDLQGGSPPIVIDFDELPCGTVLDGQTLAV